MEQFGHLWLYFLLVLGVIVLPGLDMAYVLASSLMGGRRAGLTAVAGMMTGGMCHVAATGLGLGLLIQLFPSLFNALLLAGAGYIAWIGWSLLRSRASVLELAPGMVRSPWGTFRQAVLTNLLNPKAYLFMFAVFPQFMQVRYGPLWLQAVVLSAITALTQLVVYGGLALAAGESRGWLAQRPWVGLWLARVVGLGLLGAAVYTGLTGWQGR